MTRTAFYSDDATMSSIYELDIDNWLGDLANWSAYRIWVIERIHNSIKKSKNMWASLNDLSYITDFGEENEIVDVDELINPEDLEDLENLWVLERIFSYRWTEGGDADARQSLFAKYLSYKQQREKALAELNMLFDRDDDAIVDDDALPNRLERG